MRAPARVEPLDDFLAISEWPAMAVPEGFAAGVVSKAGQRHEGLEEREEQRLPRLRGARRAARRGALLLVALAAAGSAVAWGAHLWSRDRAPAGGAEQEREWSSPPRSRELSPQLVFSTSRSAPERQVQPAPPVPSPRQTTRPDHVSVETVRTPVPPPMIHYPLCSCSSGAVVCSCVE